MTTTGPPYGPPADSSGLPFDTSLPPIPVTVGNNIGALPSGAPGMSGTVTSSKTLNPVPVSCMPQPVMVSCLTLDIKRYILVQLGYPNVEVELCDEHLEQAIRDTIDEFLRFNALNLTRFWKIPLQNGVVEYALPSDLRIVREITTFKLSQFDVIFGADLIVNPIYLRNTRDAYQDILTFWLSEAAFEAQKRTYGLNTSWEVIEGNTKIRLYPTPASDRVAIIKGTYQPDVNEISQQTIGTKAELFRRMALARAMAILGRIRGKRTSGVNTSQGVVTFDGDQLRSESKEMLDAAREELKATGKPLGFYAG
jgi:hypothetical protein